MRYTVPDYYKKFQCLAGACPETCCAGWQIVIDQKSLRKYRKAKGSFGNRIRNSVNWKEETFLQYEDRRCAFLNEDNLCDMHIEAGPEMMCATCRKYPRHVEEFENEREITLSMSCPAVAEMILGKQEPVTMRTAEDDREEEEEEFDFFLYSALQDCRDLMMKMLQDRSIPAHLRMAEVLALGHDVQNRIRAGRIFEIETVLERYRSPEAQKRLQKKILAEVQEVEKCIPEEKEPGCDLGNGDLGEYKSGQIAEKGDWGCRNADALICILDAFEVLDPAWKRDVQIWERCAGVMHPEQIPEHEIEQMVVYYLYTYFCGAVYDQDALAKVKMAIVSTLIWEELVRVEGGQQGRSLEFKERVKLAYRYSRELEHSDPNLNCMEAQMNTFSEIALHPLMGILVQKCRR